MVSAVRAVKRSTDYRRIRLRLHDPSPVEVWSDRNVHIVLFSVEPAFQARRFLAFAVAAEELHVHEPLILTVDATSEGWRATTSAPDEANLE